MTTEGYAPNTPAPQAPRIAPGLVLGERYEVEGQIGAGGMATIWGAKDKKEDKRVAVKVLAAASLGAPGDFAERFSREIKAASDIGHDHIVDVHDYGEAPDKSLYYVMEHLEGEDLAATLDREGPLPWPRARDYAVQILDALEAAHQTGFIHRDMKPENCFRTTHEGDEHFIKVIDFGIAKFLDAEVSLTESGTVMGTVAYMSPEQGNGVTIDTRTDVYAVGIMLYEMLLGEPPFNGPPMETLIRVTHDTPRSFAEVNGSVSVPDGVEELVMRAIEKQPGARFESAAAFAAALERIGGSDSGSKPTKEEAGPDETKTRPLSHSSVRVGSDGTTDIGPDLAVATIPPMDPALNEEERAALEPADDSTPTLKGALIVTAITMAAVAFLFAIAF